MPSDSGISIGSDLLGSVRGGLLMLVLSIAITGFGVYDYTQQSDAVASAVEVDATITETGIDTVSTRRGGADYKPTVSFEYQFEGTEYTAHNIYPSAVEPDYGTRSDAEAELEGYAVGDTVTAYVDPDTPGSAFLKNEESSSPLKFAAIGGIAFLLSVKSMLGSS